MLRFSSVFVASFFLSLHYGTILYLNSSLLGKFFDSEIVSLLFIIGAIGNIVILLLTPTLIKLFGKHFLFSVFAVIILLSTLGLAFTQSTIGIVISFISYSSILLTIFFYLDIFLEELTGNSNTGEIRGAYFSFLNLGIAGGPLILAILSENSNYKPIYLAAAILLIPVILISFFSFKSPIPQWHGFHQKYQNLPFMIWWSRKGIRNVTVARLILETFLAFMVIYSPIYLYSKLGFEWQEIGIIFTVMLLPFILLEFPAGELADRFFGEKEIMGIGFFIVGLSLLFMPFIGKIFIYWLIILFISRVGASLVEIMTESYFFKHVGPEDTGLISIFRLMRPISLILGSTIGILVISLFSFKETFFVFALLVFMGILISKTLVDTK